MSEDIVVDAVISEKTHMGKINFPVSVPEGLIDWLQFPDDLVQYGDKMGLSHRDVKFILGALRGKWGLQADVNPADLGGRIGMTIAEIDTIVRGLIDKNYAQFKDRLNLYRLWIVLLHVKGVRFDIR
jgi:DNA-binding MarR family transcriptional regulator